MNSILERENCTFTCSVTIYGDATLQQEISDVLIKVLNHLYKQAEVEVVPSSISLQFELESDLSWFKIRKVHFRLAQF